MQWNYELLLNAKHETIEKSTECHEASDFSILLFLFFFFFVLSLSSISCRAYDSELFKGEFHL